MTAWIVSRHPGAIRWLLSNPQLHHARVVEHLDTTSIQSGDTVAGTLPVQLIARVYQQGATYYHLQIPMARQHRGTELSADDLDSLGATLECYYACTGATAQPAVHA